MSALTLIGLAVGLAMDAFAVALGAGLQLREVTARQTFRLAWHFGLYQAFMPVLGWQAGLSVPQWLAPLDHWLAFGLLAYVGGKMIHEARKVEEEEDQESSDPTRGWTLILLSFATSIDALAVGFSLALLQVNILWPAVVIGVVAGAFTTLGLHLGARFGNLLGRRMEIVGGAILLAIGLKILVEHQGVF